MADKNPKLVNLGHILAIASLFTFLIAFFKEFLVLIAAVNIDIRIAAFSSVLILFAPSTIALGMVSPFVIKLRMDDVAHSGQVVGTLYALSTLGSIVGTLLGGFFLISYIGSTKIIFLLALLLALCALAIYVTAKRKLLPLGLLIALTIGAGIFYTPEIVFRGSNQLVLDFETPYGRYWVHDVEDTESESTRLTRQLSNSFYGTQSGMYLEAPNELLFEYTKFFSLFDHYNPHARKALAIGGGAYSYPKYFQENFPLKQLDVVEIDGALTNLAKEYFDFKQSPQTNIYHQDGRLYLNKTVSNKYDAIFLDAFTSAVTIPPHMTTDEMAGEIHRTLTEDGVLVVNVISAINGHRGEFFRAYHETLANHFPTVDVYRVKDTPIHRAQNLILVASKKPVTQEYKNSDATIAALLERRWPGTVPTDMFVLTDEFAPVERFIAKLFL